MEDEEEVEVEEEEIEWALFLLPWSEGGIWLSFSLLSVSLKEREGEGGSDLWEGEGEMGEGIPTGVGREGKDCEEAEVDVGVETEERKWEFDFDSENWDGKEYLNCSTMNNILDFVLGWSDWKYSLDVLTTGVKGVEEEE